MPQYYADDGMTGIHNGKRPFHCMWVWLVKQSAETIKEEGETLSCKSYMDVKQWKGDPKI